MCDNNKAAPTSLGYISALLNATLKSTPDVDDVGDNPDDTATHPQKKQKKGDNSSKKLESMLGEYAFLCDLASAVFDEKSGLPVIGF